MRARERLLRPAGAAAVVALGLAVATAAAAQTGVKSGASRSACLAQWKAAMSGRDGAMPADVAALYIVNLGAVDLDTDGVVSETEFVRACRRGLVQERPDGGSESLADKRD